MKSYQMIPEFVQASRGGIYLFGPFVWGLITFVFSLAGFALYWAIHHSSLRYTVPPQAR